MDEARDDREQVRGFDGLVDPRIRNKVEELARSRREGPPGDEDHTLRLIRRDLRELLMERHARHLGHHHVAKYHFEALARPNPSERFLGAGQGDHVEMVSKRSLQRSADCGLVVDHQHPGARAGGRAHGSCLERLAVARRRKDEAEERPLSELALHFDHTADLRDDPMADGQSEPRSHADGLRCEEWVEDPAQDGRGYPWPVVGHLHHDAPVCGCGRRDAKLVPIGVALGHRLSGVDDEVEDHLSQPRLVRAHRRNVLEIPNDPSAVSDLVPGHSYRRLDHTLDVDRARLLVVRPGEELDVAYDVPDAYQSLSDVLQRFVDGRDPTPPVARGLRASGRSWTVGRDQRQDLGDELRVRHRDGERIVDLVSYPRGQHAGGGHPLGEHQLFAHLSLLGANLHLPYLALDGTGQSRQVALEDVVLCTRLHRRDRARLAQAPGDYDEGNILVGRL